MKVELEVKREIVFKDVVVFRKTDLFEYKYTKLDQFIYILTDNFKTEISSVLGTASLKHFNDTILADILIPVGALKNLPCSIEYILNSTPAVGGQLDAKKEFFTIDRVALCFGKANLDKRIPTLKNYRVEVQ